MSRVISIEVSEHEGDTMEIERKFLMTGFPEGLHEIEKALVHQAYITVDPEVRVRSMAYSDGSIDYIQTIKGNGNMIRTERENPITEWEYNKEIKEIGLEPIEKEYRAYVLEDGNILEVSKVDNQFYYGEVEFKSEEQANKWRPSERVSRYIIKDITYASEYKMKNYWYRTRLEKEKPAKV